MIKVLFCEMDEISIRTSNWYDVNTLYNTRRAVNKKLITACDVYGTSDR